MLYATDRRRQPSSSEIREILKTIDLILGAETGLVLNASEFDFIPGGYEKIREFFTRVRTELREKLNPQWLNECCLQYYKTKYNKNKTSKKMMIKK